VVGSFPIGTALAQFEDLQPDVVLLDLESLADESMSAAVESGGMVRNSALVILTDDPGSFWRLTLCAQGASDIAA
jgi:DNA-binding NarL/FixJ family response regulator